MTESINDLATDTADRQIVITRVFDAPRELVFRAWTDPNHVAQWWGPTGFTNTVHEMDVRPGGIWRFVMHGPDGVDYPNRIVYSEVVEPERLAYSHGDDGEGDADTFQVEVTFDAQGGRTAITICMLFNSVAACDKVKAMGATEGLNSTLTRLDDYLPSMAAGRGAQAGDAASRELVITRVFDAPRELVFRAWTEPERLARWWGPHTFTVPYCEVDLRVGGLMLIHMRGPDGVVMPNRGIINELAEPERLVVTFTAFEDAGGIPQLETINTITFEEEDGRTKLTMKAVVVRVSAALAPAVAGMEEGWNQTLDRLGTELANG